MDPPVPNDPTLTAENPCKDYWAFKRKRKREHKKQTKAAEADAKVAKLDEDATPSAQRDERPKGKSKNWKNLDISEIKFYTPTIVIDLSFGEKMSEKVRATFTTSHRSKHEFSPQFRSFDRD